MTTIAIGTVKGAFFLQGDAKRGRFTYEAPQFKGWKVTAFTHDERGRTLLATASDVYGPALHRSGDLKTWQPIEHGPRYSEASGFKLNQVWTLHGHGRTLFAGVDEAGLFKSDDGGDTWSLVESLTAQPSRASWFPGFGGLCLHSLLFDPRDANRMFVGISAVGLFRSDDGGNSWRAKNDGVPVALEDKDHKDIGWCVHAVRMNPNRPDELFRQDHRGMFRSQNAGDTWERFEQGLPSGFGFPLALNPKSGRVFAFPLESDEHRLPPGGRLAVYVADANGREWRASTTGLPSEPHYGGVLRGALDADEHGTVAFATTAGTIHVSGDDGESWSTVPGMLPRVLAVSVFEP